MYSSSVEVAPSAAIIKTPPPF
jgi:hypothetical protein